VLATGVVAAVGFGGKGAATPARAARPPATATVTRTTLVQTEDVDGTLGFGDATLVKAYAAGTLTWLPAAGATVGRGQQVYRVDDKPVPLLFGTMPLYRILRPGLTGNDVKELESNLSALGYHGFTVDSEYTTATADVVRQWQEDLELEQTGTVAPGQVVVATGPIRVAQHQLLPGDAARGPLLTYTGTTRIVSVDLDVGKQHLVRKGLTASVELPDGTKVPGTVTAVGAVATTHASGNQQVTTIEVTLAVADQKALGALDEAPVTVTLESQRRADVLAAPVNALVALTEGGYGLQAVSGETSRYVVVKTGMFAGGKVEVSGADVTAGMVVGVPS
jgi:peptidoglycan hydrolase-like protein with peptidoglycan-binding domain